MRKSSKAAGITLLTLFAALPILSRMHSTPEPNFQEEALKDFYIQTVLVPEAMLKQRNGAMVEPCLLGARHCSDLHSEPVIPCLLSGPGCDAEPRVTLLERRLLR